MNINKFTVSFITSLIFLNLSFPVVANEMVVYEKRENKDTLAKEICINNYSYVVVVSGFGGAFEKGVAVTQVYEKSKNEKYPPQPKSCQ